MMAALQWKDQYAEVNGVRLHYVEQGKGPLILFLHGFPEFWYGWKEQLADFGKDHLAVAPDMRGYNLSSKPEAVEQYRMKHLVEDVRALAAHLGHKKFVLLGHDWGGVVAWAFAMAHPESLEKLVILNAPHPAVFLRELRDNPAQQRASQYMLLFQTPQAEAVLTANNCAALVKATLEARNGPFTEEDKAAYLSAWLQPGALTGGLNYYRASAIGPPGQGPALVAKVEEALARFGVDPARMVVKVPTLVIWGEKDTALLTGNLEGLEQFVPHLTVRRVPEGTHWVAHERPEEVNGYIREFLAQPGKA